MSMNKNLDDLLDDELDGVPSRHTASVRVTGSAPVAAMLDEKKFYNSDLRVSAFVRSQETRSGGDAVDEQRKFNDEIMKVYHQIQWQNAREAAPRDDPVEEAASSLFDFKDLSMKLLRRDIMLPPIIQMRDELLKTADTDPLVMDQVNRCNTIIHIYQNNENIDRPQCAAIMSILDEIMKIQPIPATVFTSLRPPGASPSDMHEPAIPPCTIL